MNKIEHKGMFLMTLLNKREAEIVAHVNEQGSASVRELATHFDVTEVTIRRDLTKLEALNFLRRVHGSAVRLNGILGEASILGRFVPEDARAHTTDALILAPVQNRTAHTLRERALRSHIPLVAESAPLEHAIYLGPRNREATIALGEWAGAYVQHHLAGIAHILDISQPLSNTIERSEGFAEGLRSTLGQTPTILRVNGQGLYNEAYIAASNALRVHPEINVIFGINDDSILAGLQAFTDLGRDRERVLAANIGGEGKTLFNMLAQGGPLKACVAMFPEIVARLALEGIMRMWNGEDIGTEIITPHAIITPATLTEFYERREQGWLLKAEAIERLAPAHELLPLTIGRNKRVSFVILYRSHEWYQSLAHAMQETATDFGIALSVQDVTEDLHTAIDELRRRIGQMAASYVQDGDVVILDSGTATESMAQFLDTKSDVTIVTNSLTIFRRLQQNKQLRVLLTGGELYRDSPALVGRSAELMLQGIRATKAFITADGVSTTFGVSCTNESEAAVRRAMIYAAREIVLLADHTTLGVDSLVKLVDLAQIHVLITDAGAVAADRLEYQQRGIKVLVEEGHTSSKCQEPHQVPLENYR
jgi:DeoR/GlpR family transcriptional regulator of sugar metabolism